MIGELLHEQYNSDGDPVLFSCTECEFRTQSLGHLHAHVEEHWSLLEWFRWHTYGWLFAVRSDGSKWMDSTEIVRVQEVEEISIEEVEGL